MEITRYVFNKWTKNQVKFLKKEYNLEVEEGYCTLWIKENDVFFQLEPVFEKWKVDKYHERYFSFSKKEILNAEYCIIRGCHEGGYPMPDNLEYQELTYDMEVHCLKCGMIIVQKDAFRIQKVPKHKIFGLTWVWDELFVQLDVYQNIFEPLGIKCREVKLYRGDKIIPNIVQLVIPDTEEPLDLHEYSSQICPVCGRIKYEAKVNGFYPIHQHPLPHLYRSKEYFGDGGAASRKIFISGELRDILIKEKLMKYYWFDPCRDSVPKEPK